MSRNIAGGIIGTMRGALILSDCALTLTSPYSRSLPTYRSIKHIFSGLYLQGLETTETAPGRNVSFRSSILEGGLFLSG